MSNPCAPDTRPVWYPDYSESLQTDTLRKIHAELKAKKGRDERDENRIAQIEKILRRRGFKFRPPVPQPTTMKPKKQRAHNHVPASHREKPVKLGTPMSQAELEAAKRQAAKFLTK